MSSDNEAGQRSLDPTPEAGVRGKGARATAARARGDRAAPEAPRGAEAEPEEFTLDISFSGLCLLVQRTADRQLRVLLPPTQEHEGMPEHLAVLGAHERYVRADDGNPFEGKGRFREYVLCDGDAPCAGILTFDPPLEPEADPTATLRFPGVADLTAVAGNRPPLPDRAKVCLDIDRGAVCDECAHEEGTFWRFNGKEQRMATRLAWRIPKLRNTTPDGRLGVRIRYEARGRTPVHFVIRPVREEGSVDYRAAFYLCHTPRDELPSHPGHPLQQAEQAGDRNHHFGAYFDLFAPKIEARLPERVPDPEEENDDDDTEEQDEEQQPQTAAADVAAGTEDAPGLALMRRFLNRGRLNRFAASRFLMYSGFHGRLYTCTVATVKEPSDTTLQAGDHGSPSPAALAGGLAGDEAGTGDDEAGGDA